MTHSPPELTGSHEGSSGDDIDAFIDALDKLASNEKTRKADLFSKLYPAIAAAIARRAPQREILRTLRQFNLAVHPKNFTELMNAEKQRRLKVGDTPVCSHCRQLIASNVDPA